MEGVNDKSVIGILLSSNWLCDIGWLCMIEFDEWDEKKYYGAGLYYNHFTITLWLSEDLRLEVLIYYELGNFTRLCIKR